MRKFYLLGFLIALGANGGVALGGPLSSMGSMFSHVRRPAGPDLEGAQATTVADYVVASKLVLSADSKMAQALHLDGDIATLKATSDSLKAGASEGDLKNSDVTLNKSTTDILASLKTNPQLDAKSKSLFAAGIGDLALGAFEYVKVGKEVSSSQSALSSASPMQLVKLGPLVYVARTMPSNAKTFTQALTAATEFAKGQNIPVPANAADATSALGAI